MSSEIHLSFALICITIILLISRMSLAAEIVCLAQPLKDGETLLSSHHVFELGFFSHENSENRFLGIWYKNIPDTIVWVANRNNPITDFSGVLTIDGDGNIVILNQSKSIVWSTNISRIARNPVAQLLDSGNFVVRDNISNSSEIYLWQSFDYPTDTQLPGMKVGWDSRTGLERILTSWKSRHDPSQGEFTYKIDIQGIPQLVVQKGSVKVARSGPWNGAQFGTIPVVPYMVFNPTRVVDEDEIYVLYEPVSNDIIMRINLNQSGLLEFQVWNGHNTGWKVFYSMTYDQCENYGQCGPNAVCNLSKKPVCECFEGFFPKTQKEWTAHNWTSGCVKSTPRDCKKGEGFLKLERVKLPDLLDYQMKKSFKLSDCEAECSKSCFCTAYANTNVSAGGESCLMWFGNLVDIRMVNQEYKGHDVYIRTPASNSESSSNSNPKRRKIVLAVSITIGIFLFSFIFCCIIWKNKANRRGQLHQNRDIELPLFDLATINDATNNFSQENMIGKGGFGPVYKGNLQTGEAIAVKRLSKNSRQGAEQFMSEVDLIAKIHHKNLVGLLGCCVQGEERMLIYEYMANKSLDYFIFDHQRSTLLGWQERFAIILGIAKGLLYLHQDSKLQIIHRDIKTSNILLDNDLNPKISDFGLARILEVDQMVAITKRIVGTYGYMSPEYGIDGKFSVKSDVFSFGVILLEIVTGKKNKGFCATNHDHNLLEHAWLHWREGRALEVIDENLRDSCIKQQVLRCIQVGLMCVQNFPSDRPKMSSVVFMLDNEVALLPQPKQPGFFRTRSSISNVIKSSTGEETKNTMTITLSNGR